MRYGSPPRGARGRERPRRTPTGPRARRRRWARRATACPERRARGRRRPEDGCRLRRGTDRPTPGPRRVGDLAGRASERQEASSKTAVVLQRRRGCGADLVERSPSEGSVVGDVALEHGVGGPPGRLEEARVGAGSGGGESGDRVSVPAGDDLRVERRRLQPRAIGGAVVPALGADPVDHRLGVLGCGDSARGQLQHVDEEPRGIGGDGVVARGERHLDETRVVGEHALVVRHTPVAAGGVAEEAPLDQVVQVGAGHGGEGAGCHVSGIRSIRRQSRVLQEAQNGSVRELRGLERGPGGEAGVLAVLAGHDGARRGGELLEGGRSVCRCGGGGGQSLAEGGARGIHFVPAFGPRLADRGEHLTERGLGRARGRREVGAGVENAPLGRGEDRQGPPEVRGEGGCRVEIGGVDVGMLLAIDLDRHEAGVEFGSGLGVLERLARHHVTPVAGAVADRDHHGDVSLGRERERLGPPGEPRDGIVGVGPQVGARGVREAVHARGCADLS